jgi:hypothetical protein
MNVLRTVRGTPTGLVEMEKWRRSMISMGEESVEVEGFLEVDWGI